VKSGWGATSARFAEPRKGKWAAMAHLIPTGPFRLGSACLGGHNSMAPKEKKGPRRKEGAVPPISYVKAYQPKLLCALLEKCGTRSGGRRGKVVGPWRGSSGMVGTSACYEFRQLCQHISASAHQHAMDTEATPTSLHLCSCLLCSYLRGSVRTNSRPHGTATRRQ
jgi:hypothetical protein